MCVYLEMGMLRSIGSGALSSSFSTTTSGTSLPCTVCCTRSRASCWWVTGHVMLMELDLVVNHLLVLWVLAALLWQMAGHR